MSEINRINLSVIKTYKSDFINEKDNYNTSTHAAFLNGYVYNSSDATIVCMRNRLKVEYSRIENAYRQIETWWESYIQNLEGIENYISNDGGSGAISESLLRNYLFSQLEELPDYRPDFTKLKFKESSTFDFAMSTIQDVGKSNYKEVGIETDTKFGTASVMAGSMLGASILNAFKGVKAAVSNIGSNIVSKTGDIVENIGDFFNKTSAKIASGITDLGDKATDFFDKTGNEISELATNTGAAISTGITSAWANVTKWWDDNTSDDATRKTVSLTKNISKVIDDSKAKSSNQTMAVWETLADETRSNTEKTKAVNKEVLTELEGKNSKKTNLVEDNHTHAFEQLINIDLDIKKIFGDDITYGLDGEEIFYDKKRVDDYGYIYYYKDGKIVKTIDKNGEWCSFNDPLTGKSITLYSDGTKVIVEGEGDEEIKTTYNLDGSYSIEKLIEEPGTTTFYYDRNGILIKCKEYGGYERIYKDGNQEIYDIYKNGILYSKVNGNNSIYYNSDGTLDYMSEKTDKGTVYTYYDLNGGIKKIINNDNTIYYNEDGTIKSIKYDYGNEIQEIEYKYLATGTKYEYITMKDKTCKLIAYYTNGTIEETIGKRNGSTFADDGSTYIARVEGVTTVYDKSGVVLSTTKDGVTTKNTENGTSIEYSHWKKNKLEETLNKYNLEINTHLGLFEKAIENYDKNNNLINITIANTYSVNNGDTQKVTHIINLDSTVEEISITYNPDGIKIKEVYYKRDANGNILSSNTTNY